MLYLYYYHKCLSISFVLLAGLSAKDTNDVDTKALPNEEMNQWKVRGTLR